MDMEHKDLEKYELRTWNQLEPNLSNLKNLKPVLKYM